MARFDRRRWSGGSIAGMLVVVVVIAGCGSFGASERLAFEERPYGERPLTSLAADALTAFGRSMREADRLAQACMRREGFEDLFAPVEVALVDAGPPGSDAVVLDPPPLTVERAERFGYGEPPSVGPSAEDLMREALESLDPEARAEWERAFFGTGAEVEVVTDGGEVYRQAADGCLAEGRELVGGDLSAALQWNAVVNQILGLRADAQERAMADERVGAVVEEWSRCMREVGFDFERPLDAVTAGLALGDGPLVPASEEEATPSVTEQERRLAVADARCREVADYQRVIDEVTSYYENVVMVENEAVVLRWGETVAEMEAVADRFDR